MFILQEISLAGKHILNRIQTKKSLCKSWLVISFLLRRNPHCWFVRVIIIRVCVFTLWKGFLLSVRSPSTTISIRVIHNSCTKELRYRRYICLLVCESQLFARILLLDHLVKHLWRPYYTSTHNFSLLVSMNKFLMIIILCSLLISSRIFL